MKMTALPRPQAGWKGPVAQLERLARAGVIFAPVEKVKPI